MAGIKSELNLARSVIVVRAIINADISTSSKARAGNRGTRWPGRNHNRFSQHGNANVDQNRDSDLINWRSARRVRDENALRDLIEHIDVGKAYADVTIGIPRFADHVR
jgi:hypothetical protein